MDTSASMDDEAAALCGDLNKVVARLEAAGLDVLPQLLAICDLPGGAYGCLTDRIDMLLGTSLDEDEDGVPDECATATTVPLRPELGFRLSSYPNPFNPRTTITYSIPQAAHVELAIYDLAGRHVRTLVSAHMTAGEHQIRWNGEDDEGAQVASGVYLYQLRAGDFEETKRMVLLK